jgi:16S rRNA (cytidine1402-2'-O)-methyltransferase
MAKLYIVATPIGNLEDITIRAIRILSEVDIVFCEDTREGRKLLSHFNIKKDLDSYHAQSKENKVEKIIKFLSRGMNVALISDAGTPGISDPGVMLVSKVLQAVQGVEIISVPGPSALTAALSIAGLPSDEFVFYGFLPHKKGRETIFREISVSKRASTIDK